jgi:sodium-dependent dicarboxylate transporter 2/3/5
VLPILAAAAIAGGINPLYLMLPATISASFAFMLPVATPPNAIVYGSGKIKVEQMMKAGLILNLIGVLVITGMFTLFGTSVFGN